MDENAVRQHLIELGALDLFKNVAEVIAIFDQDGNGSLEQDEIQVIFTLCVCYFYGPLVSCAYCLQVLEDFIRTERASKATAQPSPASELPRVVRAFLKARSLLSERIAAAAALTAAAAADGPKVLHLKDSCALPNIEDHLQSNINEMQLTISSLEEELRHKQHQLLETHSRAQGLEESILEYDQLLQQSADDMEHLKLDHAMQLQKVSLQERTATQRLLQLRNDSEQAVTLESQRLDELRQQLQKQQLQVQQERAELNAQRSAVQMQLSTADVALSTVANQRATMLVQHSQLNSDSNSAKERWQLQQVRSLQCMRRHTIYPIVIRESPGAPISCHCPLFPTAGTPSASNETFSGSHRREGAAT